MQTILNSIEKNMFRYHINTNKYHARFWLFPNISIVSYDKPIFKLKIFHKPSPNRLRDPIICLEIPIPSRFSLDFPAEKLCKYCSVSTLPNPKLLNDSKLSTRAPTLYTSKREQLFQDAYDFI